MNTIEERAINSIECYDCGSMQYVDCDICIIPEKRKAYIQGAKEYVEKACDAYCKCCETQECVEQGVNKEDCYFRQEFRKAMEE